MFSLILQALLLLLSLLLLLLLLLLLFLQTLVSECLMVGVLHLQELKKEIDNDLSPKVVLPFFLHFPNLLLQSCTLFFGSSGTSNA